MSILQLNRWNGAFGAVLEDEAREQEAAAEEVDGESVENAVLTLAP